MRSEHPITETELYELTKAIDHAWCVHATRSFILGRVDEDFHSLLSLASFSLQSRASQLNGVAAKWIREQAALIELPPNAPALAIWSRCILPSIALLRWLDSWLHGDAEQDLEHDEDASPVLARLYELRDAACSPLLAAAALDEPSDPRIARWSAPDGSYGRALLPTCGEFHQSEDKHLHISLFKPDGLSLHMDLDGREAFLGDLSCTIRDGIAMFDLSTPGDVGEVFPEALVIDGIQWTLSLE